MKKLISLSLVFFSLSVDASDIEATWNQGAFLLPKAVAAQMGSPQGNLVRVDRFSSKLIAHESIERVPVAIVMHGCSGITAENAAAAKMLAGLGFAVFLPNYYARSNVSPMCAGSAEGVPYFTAVTPQLVKLRTEEFDYALSKAQSLPFIDPKRAVAYGHSMGGGVVAALGRSDLKAAIITGWPCSSPHFHQQSHPAVPQLAIRFKDDPWLPSGWACDAKPFSGRDATNTVSLVLDGQRTHEVLHDARAQEAIRQFVEKHVLKGE